MPSSPAFPDVLIDLFEGQVRQAPDLVALEHGELRWSYRELDDSAERLARRIVQMHGAPLPPETLVALCFARGPWRIVGLLAALKAGAAYLPLDPAHPDARLRSMLHDAQPALLLTQRALADRDLGDTCARTLCVDDACDAELPPFARPPLRGDHLAYLIYTSGSTGTPKGVMLEHAGVCRLAQDLSRRLALGPGVRVLQFSSFSFDASVFEWIAALTTGGTLVLAADDELPPLADVAETLAQRDIHVALLPPSVLRAMKTRPLPALRTLICGGEACTPDIVRDWAPGRRLLNAYGPTEASVICTVGELSDGDEPHLGEPIAGHQVLLLDERLQPVPPGATGELCVAGRGLARGYLHADELTARRFVTLPAGHPQAGLRVYRTGDLACRGACDGRLRYLGRADRQVKLNGLRIELGEIEQHLVLHPEVVDAALVHRPKECGGEGLVAWIVRRGGAADPVSFGGALAAWLRERLPAGMLPHRYVQIDALPLTPPGKIDRDALQRRSVPPPSIGGDACCTDAERRLQQVWQSVLGVDAVGRDDNFFSLGGDSILAIRMVHGAEVQGLAVTGALLARHPTLRALAEHAQPLVPSCDEAPLPVGEPFGLTPIQCWFFEQDFAEPHRFSQYQLVAMPAADLDRAAQAVERLLSRFDAFRLRFPVVDGRRRQVYAERAPTVPLKRASIAGSADAGLALDALCRRWLQDFDIDAGRTVSLGIVDGHPDGRPRLFIGLHHLVCDGLSWRVMLEELCSLHAGRGCGAPGLPLVHWQAALQAHAVKPDTVSQLAHWVQAKEVPPGFVAALERGRPVAGPTRLHTLERTLDDVLPATAAALNGQRMAILLAAFVHCLSRRMGMRRIALQLEGHGREASVGPDPGRSVGWYTTLFPALFELPADGDLPAAFEAVRQQLHRIPDRGLSYGVLRYLHPHAGIRGALAGADSPVLFNYLGSFRNPPAHGPAGWQIYDANAAQDAASPQHRGPALLELNCAVVDDRFVCRLGHVQGLFDDAEAHDLAEDFMREARAISLALANCSRVPKAYPLTPLQEGMLFHHRLAPASDQYLVQAIWRYATLPDAQRLQRAWARLVRELDPLRTFFRWEPPARPQQCVAPQADIEFRWTDLSALDDAERERCIDGLLADDRARPFDLERPGLMRVHVLQTGPRTADLLWTYHHLILDGWSSSLVLQRLHALYEADDDLAMPPARPRFEHHVEQLLARDAAPARAHFAALLAGGDWSTDIGVRRRDAVLDPLKTVLRQAQADLTWSVEDTGRVTALQRTHGITPGTLALFAFGALLSACDEGRDVLFGTTLSGRHHGVDQLVGMTINTLPVLLRLRPDAPVHDALHQMQLQVAQLNEHGAMPLRAIEDPSTGRPAQFNALMVFENYPGQDRVDGASLQASLVREIEKTGYPLTATCRLRDGVVQLQLLFDSDVFEAAAMARLVRQWAGLMRQAAAEPQRPCAVLRLADSADSEALRLYGPPVRHRYRRIEQAFEVQVASQPQRLAVVCGERELSYAQLDALADEVHALLVRAGAVEGSLVAVVSDRTPELLAGLLGILKAGCAYVPLDLDAPAARLRGILDQAGIVHVLDLHPLAAQLVGEPAAVHASRHARLLRRVLPCAPARIDTGGDALACVMYTSGSTGRPKGVMVTHRGILRLVLQPNHFEFAPGQRMLQAAAIGFDASALEMWGMLLNGGTLVQVSADVLLDPPAAARALREHRIDLLFLTTPLFHRWASEDPSAFAPLRQLMVGGDVLPPDSAARVCRAHPALVLLNAYGPTENATLSTFHRVDGPPHEAVPIGRPVSGTWCVLLDRWQREVPAGTVGELWVGGDGLAAGYLHDAAATAERFVQRSGDERLYRTGDRARLRDDGALEFLGRTDHQVKIRGQRVEPEEIEWHLQRHPAVREAAVVLRGGGAADKRLVAFCVLHDPSAGPAGALLDAALQACLPAAMRPQHYECIDRLPLTPGGKVDRGALRERPLRAAPAAPVAEALTPQQRAVQAAWQACLGLEAIGLDQGFYSLGGDSLNAFRVCALLREQGYRLRVSDLMRHPTIRACSGRLERLADDVDTPVPDGDLVPLSAVQQRFFQRGLARPGHFVIPLILRLRRPLPAAPVREALVHALQGQDGPCVRFVRDPGGGPWRQQRVDWDPNAWFSRVDLKPIDVRRHRQHVVDHAERVCSSFDLSAGPLFRATVFEGYEAGDTLMHLAFHHLVCDGVSLGLLLDRVRDRIRSDSVSPARAPRTSYLQWCRLLDRHARARAAAPPQAPIPPAPLSPSLRATRPTHREMASHTSVSLRDAAELGACARAAAGFGTTTFALLLAAMSLALHRTGVAPPALHIQTAQREAVIDGVAIDLHDTIGYFCAALPIRLPRAGPLAGMLEDVDAQLRALNDSATETLLRRYLLPAIDARWTPPHDPCAVMFHYLADDPLQRSDEVFAPCDLPAGTSTDPGNTSNYLLNITAVRRGDRLDTSFYYSPAHYRPLQIEGLADAFREALRHVPHRDPPERER